MAFKLTYSDGQEDDYDDGTQWEVEAGVLKMGHEPGKWTVLVSPSHWATIETGPPQDEDHDQDKDEDERKDKDEDERKDKDEDERKDKDEDERKDKDEDERKDKDQDK